jgi:pantoate kinase
LALDAVVSVLALASALVTALSMANTAHMALVVSDTGVGKAVGSAAGKVAISIG